MLVSHIVLLQMQIKLTLPIQPQKDMLEQNHRFKPVFPFSLDADIGGLSLRVVAVKVLCPHEIRYCYLTMTRCLAQTIDHKQYPPQSHERFMGRVLSQPVSEVLLYVFIFVFHVYPQSDQDQRRLCPERRVQ